MKIVSVFPMHRKKFPIESYKIHPPTLSRVNSLLHHLNDWTCHLRQWFFVFIKSLQNCSHVFFSQFLTKHCWNSQFESWMGHVPKILEKVPTVWVRVMKFYRNNSQHVFYVRMKQLQEEENQRYKQNMQTKMDMLLKLKSDITANRVYIVPHFHFNIKISKDFIPNLISVDLRTISSCNYIFIILFRHWTFICMDGEHFGLCICPVVQLFGLWTCYFVCQYLVVLTASIKSCIHNYSCLQCEQLF